MTAPGEPARLSMVSAGVLASLYLSQGLPSGFIAHAMPALMRHYAVPVEYIGLIKLVALPWLLKFLWAPWVETRSPPGFRSSPHSTSVGKHRSWILTMQLALVILLVMVGMLEPALLSAQGTWLLLLLMLMLNCCGATQDIATDGMAVTLLPPRLRGLGNSIQVVGYKVGMLFGGPLLLMVIAGMGWYSGMWGLATLVALATLPIWCFRETPAATVSPGVSLTTTKPASGGTAQVGLPGSEGWWPLYRGFFQRPGIGWWLVVLLTYKISDALGSAMIKPMMVDNAIALGTVGQVTLYASFAGMGGAVLGGWLYYRWGAARALLGFGVFQAVAMLAWIPVAGGVNGESLALLYGVAGLDQVADGMSTVTLFALMMDHCRKDREGADYTLQACIQLLLAGMAGAVSGLIAGSQGYQFLFALAGTLGFASLIPVVVYVCHPAFAKQSG